MRSFYLIILLLMVLPETHGAENGTSGHGSDFIAAELQRTRFDPDSAVSVSIAAPRDYVFDFLSARLDEYADGAAALRFDHTGSASTGRLGRGSLRMTTMDNGETLAQRFLLFTAPTEFAYYTNMELSTLSVPLDYSITRYSLNETNYENTELSVTVSYQASSKLFAFIVRRAFNSALRRDFERAANIIAEKYKDESAE
ncbi:MAG: hypothetical protein CMP84_10700 [Gammaproteobacteria bacterium]|jgi:hypothetical protein|nr:hypothetical protein [Gammaproteobacteria bacterium]MBU15001.1 hypothetical protein [Gammaproteobacteria bacterium]|tara:strand:- start:285 stop:881 length:597 start_codon:yes stop_codon:yes gene_type:complete